MKRNFYITILLSTLLAVGGCAFKAEYNPEYVKQELSSLSATIDGKSLIYTKEAADNRIYSQKPTSLTGAATKLDVKVGYILKNISLELFSAKFKDGAEHSNSLGDAGNYSIVIQPEISNYEYRYNQLKNIGFAITPEVKITLQVQLYDKTGSIIMDKSYDTNDYVSKGETYIASFSPHEKINATIHKVILGLLHKVVKDVEAELK